MDRLIPHSSPWITDADNAAVSTMLKSGMIACGDATADFEKRCASYLGKKKAVAVASGQAALILALTSLEIGPGDKVILPTYVCHDVEDAIVAVGAEPVFCDCGDNWCMSAKSVATVMSKKVKAVIAVHIFGIECDISGIAELGVPVIEDGCQYFYPDSSDEAHLSVYSFHATKCLTTGEGGLIAGNDADLIPDVGAERLSDLQASLGLAQLSRYEDMLERRRRIAGVYTDVIPAKYTAGIRACADKTIYLRYPLLVEAGFEAVAGKFQAQGITVRRGVDALLHRDHDLPDAEFPKATALFEKTVSIPLYPALSDEDVTRIAAVAAEILA